MIAATFDPDDVQDVLTSGRTLDPAAVGSQLVIMSAASVSLGVIRTVLHRESTNLLMIFFLVDCHRTSV